MVICFISSLRKKITVILLHKQTCFKFMPMKRLIVILLLFVSAFSVRAADCVDGMAEKNIDDVYWVNLIGVGVVTAWGVANWDYFTRTPHSNPEGWFGADTDEGGADKVGHFYSSYVTAHGLSAYFKSKCFSHDDAAYYGALSSFLIMGYMELGDSFSDYGSSYEDFVSNTLASLAGYYLYKYPELANKYDIRWEYGFHPNKSDFVTDYENSKYLLAIKLNGFEATRKGFLKHLELHLGYYTRGYDDNEQTNERNLYLGVGLNLTDFFRRRGYKKTATLFNYYQLPGSYLAYEKDFNE